MSSRSHKESEPNVTIDEFLKQNARHFDSPWERRFAEDVLGRVPGLNLEDVLCQVAFRDAQGKRRRIDFMIKQGEHVSIAIEVDGWDKTGRGSGPTKREWISDRARKLSIIAHGYELLEFPNALVRTMAGECARLIELKLKLVAERHDAGRTVGRSEDADAPTLSQAEREEFERLDGERSAAVEELQIQLSMAHRENKGMKTVVMASSAVIITILIVGWSLLDRARVDGSDPMAGSDPFCPNALTWDQARAFAGQSGTFRGEVVSATFVENSVRQPTFLNVGRPFPDPSRLTVVVWGRDRGRFPQPPEVAYSEGREICVSGAVTLFEGVVQIEISSPAALSVR